LGEVPVIGLTATATPKVQEDILKKFRDYKHHSTALYYGSTQNKNVESDIIRFISSTKEVRNYLLLKS
jgi:ATP-dependent DNA helicase RecQ